MKLPQDAAERIRLPPVGCRNAFMQLVDGVHGEVRRAGRVEHSTWLAVADDTQVGGWIRRFQSERPVGTVVVVVGDVDAEHLLKVPARRVRNLRYASELPVR
jgi:hypothetical protein